MGSLRLPSLHRQVSVDLVEPSNSLARLPSVSLKAEPQDESQRCNVLCSSSYFKQQMGVAQSVIQ